MRLSINRFKIVNCRHLLTLLFAVFPSMCFSQTEIRDTVSIGQHGTDNISLRSEGWTDSISENVIAHAWRYNPASDALFPYRQAYPLDLHVPDLYFVPGQARLFHWNTGEIIASGGVTKFSGMMQLDNGALGVYQSVGSLSFYAGGIVNKYGYFRGAHTQYGLNGSISYQFTPRFSATLFGEHYFGRPPLMANGMSMPPSMIGYYGRSAYGISFDYKINDHWGVETGVQSVQQFGSNKYKAEPIVTPYYRINKKVAIGLPVGQILYHILRK